MSEAVTRSNEGKGEECPTKQRRNEKLVPRHEGLGSVSGTVPHPPIAIDPLAAATRDLVGELSSVVDHGRMQERKGGGTNRLSHVGLV